MNLFFRCFISEVRKTKRLAIGKAHFLIPLCIAVVFLAYYAYTPWDAYSKIQAYFQVLGIGFPFLIGLFCVLLAEQELSAGQFQVMLSVPKRLPMFFSKLFLLILLGTFSIFLASVFFGVGYQYFFQASMVNSLFYIKAALILLGSNIFLYILHFFLSLRFNKGISIGIGIIESLISALFLTGMGDDIWCYVPCAWSSRLVTYALTVANGQELHEADYNIAIFMCIFITVSAIILFSIWVCRWEGQNTSD